MFKLKVVVVGPLKAGKTTLSNFLAEASDSPSGEYRPTKGVRILEFESEAQSASTSATLGGRSTKVDVELWDASGDNAYENCWPVIQENALGIVFVYNPLNPSHARELDNFYAHFVSQRGLRDKNCIVFANIRENNQDRKGKLSSSFSRIPQIDANFLSEGEMLASEFQRFLGTLVESLKDRQDKAEMNIIRN